MPAKMHSSDATLLRMLKRDLPITKIARWARCSVARVRKLSLKHDAELAPHRTVRSVNVPEWARIVRQDYLDLHRELGPAYADRQCRALLADMTAGC